MKHGRDSAIAFSSTFILFPACDRALGHGRRHGGHVELCDRLAALRGMKFWNGGGRRGGYWKEGCVGTKVAREKVSKLAFRKKPFLPFLSATCILQTKEGGCITCDMARDDGPRDQTVNRLGGTIHGIVS